MREKVSRGSKNQEGASIKREQVSRGSKNQEGVSFKGEQVSRGSRYQEGASIKREHVSRGSKYQQGASINREQVLYKEESIKCEHHEGASVCQGRNFLKGPMVQSSPGTRMRKVDKIAHLKHHSKGQQCKAGGCPRFRGERQDEVFVGLDWDGPPREEHCGRPLYG